MVLKILRLVFLLALPAAVLPATPAQAQRHPSALLYLRDDTASVRSFLDHKDKIDILVPTWYSVDETGLVTGEPNPVVLREARQAHVSVVPIVLLVNKDEAHKLILDQHAQDEMNAAFLRECRENGYDGIQFDFEDILWTDRDGLSALVRKTAQVMHAAHLQVEIATIPNAPGHAGSTAFGRWIFEEWRGVFDLKALAQSVDLICLMTYDQHTVWTVPGPVGGWPWTLQNIDYALTMVPPEKLSLGIPLYGYHWFTGDPGLGKGEKKGNPTAEYISQPDAMFLHQTYGGDLQWDPVDHTTWFFFYRDQMREWIFFTDKRGFADRYELVRQKHLQGFCAWVLGQEDPAIWDVLPAHR